MKDKVFFDTNILVYMQSGMDPEKATVSRSLFEKSAKENLIVLSTQVLQEFYVAMTRKLNHEPQRVKRILSHFLDFEIVHIHASFILEAIDISILHQLSFWDSLIIRSAVHSNCKTVYSEDMHHGQIIHDVKIMNPFHGEIIV